MDHGSNVSGNWLVSSNATIGHDLCSELVHLRRVEESWPLPFSPHNTWRTICWSTWWSCGCTSSDTTRATWWRWTHISILSTHVDQVCVSGVILKSLVLHGVDGLLESIQVFLLEASSTGTWSIRATRGRRGQAWCWRATGGALWRVVSTRTHGRPLLLLWLWLVTVWVGTWWLLPPLCTLWPLWVWVVRTRTLWRHGCVGCPRRAWLVGRSTGSRRHHWGSHG